MEGLRIRRTAKNLCERCQRTSAKKWGTEPCKIYGARNGRILLPMTRHKHTHTGLVTPSLPQLLLTAMLHLFAMLVSSVASTLQMTRRRLAAECHSDVTPAGLPRETSDTNQETTAAQHSSPITLILRDREAIVSKDEGVLTPVSQTHNGSVPKVRVPGESRGPVPDTKRAKRTEPLRAKSQPRPSPGMRVEQTRPQALI